MFYLTNARYRKLVQSLELNLPFAYGQEAEYYQGSKLKSFDLDLTYFTQSEAKALLISDLLFQDTAEALTRMFINKQDKEQDNWVFELGVPRYHSDPECKRLNSDFFNVRIPKSLDRARIEEYRQYFKAHYENYGRADGQREPRIFMRKLIELFSLNEYHPSTGEKMDLDTMTAFYFRGEHYDNSEVAEFNATLNFELEAGRIQKFIHGFKLLVDGVDVQDVRRAWFKKSKTEQKNEFDEIFRQRKALVARVLNFHFRKLVKKGLDINKEILEMTGLQPCRCCKVNPVQSAWDEIPF